LTELVERSLGLKGVEYVKSCLQQGTGMCSLLLPMVVGGWAFAPVPTGTDQRRAEKFQVGGLMPRQKMKVWLIEHLEGLCQTEPQSTVVFQDVWAAPTDPAIRSTTSNKLLTDRNVYYFIEARGFLPSLVERALSELTSYLLVGVFTHFGIKSTELLKDHRTTEAVIADAVREMEEIFVGAYDQEGIVVWRRQENL
jgi:hypothetical protein